MQIVLICESNATGFTSQWLDLSVRQSAFYFHFGDELLRGSPAFGKCPPPEFLRQYYAGVLKKKEEEIYLPRTITI